MSQQAAKRRRSQARNGYGHLCPMQRPGYKSHSNSSVAESIAAERRKAARMAAASSKKK